MLVHVTGDVMFTLLHLSHMLIVNVFSSVKTTGHQWGPAKSGVLCWNASQTARCWAMSIVLLKNVGPSYQPNGVSLVRNMHTNTSWTQFCCAAVPPPHTKEQILALLLG